MEDEFQTLQENNTWELVPLPPKRKVVQCKWVYQTKLVADGFDIKHKAKLVAKGYSQVHGVDYTETFAPVAKMDSIRLVLALVAVTERNSYGLGYHNRQLDSRNQSSPICNINKQSNTKGSNLIPYSGRLK